MNALNAAHYTILRSGDRVLVQLDHFPDPASAGRIKEQLTEAFPGVFFALIDGSVQAVLHENAPVDRATTFVLASDRPAAIAWCKRNHVPPFGRLTVIATREERLRGYDLHDGDRVVLISPNRDLYETFLLVKRIADARRVSYSIEAAS